MKQRAPISHRPKKARNNLLALGSAAVLAVYSTGYFRTRSAAQRFDSDASSRRPSGATATSIVPAVMAPARAKPGSPATTVATTPAPPPTPVPASKAVTVPLPPALALVAGTNLPTVVPAAPIAAVSPVPNAGAPTNDVPAKPIAVAPAKWKDGKFSGWGSCRHGDIEATVEIKDGRIISAIVSDCRTRYSCDVIDGVVPQVVLRQSADIDTVSGATQSADAFYYAVSAALARAKPDPAKPI